MGIDNVNYDNPLVKGYITQDRKNYIVIKTGNILSVGQYVILENNAKNFEEENIDINDLDVGSEVNCESVDRVWLKNMNGEKELVKKDAREREITLNEQQIEAITDIYIMYGLKSGEVQAFWNAYKTYGDTDELAKNYSGFKYVPESTTSSDLANLSYSEARKASRWMLYKYGKYVLINPEKLSR